jgi:hypothetical protein
MSLGYYGLYLKIKLEFDSSSDTYKVCKRKYCKFLEIKRGVDYEWCPDCGGMLCSEEKQTKSKIHQTWMKILRKLEIEHKFHLLGRNDDYYFLAGTEMIDEGYEFDPVYFGKYIHGIGEYNLSDYSELAYARYCDYYRIPLEILEKEIEFEVLFGLLVYDPVSNRIG